jgi:GH35 family endo-1,4-beta-xylanase
LAESRKQKRKLDESNDNWNWKQADTISQYCSS